MRLRKPGPVQSAYRQPFADTIVPQHFHMSLDRNRAERTRQERVHAGDRRRQRTCREWPMSLETRIRRKSLQDRIVTPEEAAALIKDGMTIGMSGFTKAGDAKAVPLAMAERAAREKFRITLMTGASLGHDIDKMLTERAFSHADCPSNPIACCARRLIAARSCLSISTCLKRSSSFVPARSARSITPSLRRWRLPRMAASFPRRRSATPQASQSSPRK